MRPINGAVVIIIIIFINIIIKEFRPISLTNTAGKLFFAVLNTRMNRYMVANGYLNTAVQKGFIEGVPGCVEHGARLMEALQDAKTHHRSICVSFLDLENAYGSVRHNLLQFAMSWYHFPKLVCERIFNYYERQVARVCTDEWNSDWFQLGIGVYQGCTGSTGLFTIAFNLILDDVMRPETQEFGYQVPGASAPTLLTGYADDIAIITKRTNYNQAIINRIVRRLDWTGSMRAKPVKCRSLAFKQVSENGQYRYKATDPKLEIRGEVFKCITDEPFKFLGTLLDQSLTNQIARARTLARLKELFALVDSRQLRGTQKLWIYNYYIATKLSWLIMVHDFPISFVRELDAIATASLKKWSGLAHSANVDILFAKRSNKGLQLKNLQTYFKQMQLVRYHLLKHSHDTHVREIYERASRREPSQKLVWQPVHTLEHIEMKLQRDIEANEQAQRHAGLGWEPATPVRLPTPAERRKAINVFVSETAETE